MSRFKASLLLDPRRRREQSAFVRDRVSLWLEVGDSVWTEITEEQAELFAARGIVVQFHKSADLVLLPAVMFDPAEEEPDPPAELTARAPSGDAATYYLVQFNAPPSHALVAALEDLGATYVDEMGFHVSVFKMSWEQANEARAMYGVGQDQPTPTEAAPFVRWVGLYHPAYALSYRLIFATGDTPGGPLVANALTYLDADKAPPEPPPPGGAERPLTARELSTMRVDPSALQPFPTGTLEVTFFADLTTAEMRTAVEDAGATVVSDTGRTLVIDLPAERLKDVLRVPGVRAVEPHRPSALANHRAGMVMGANEVRRFGNVNFLVNLDGAGETVGVFDSGLDNGNPATLHTDFMTGGVAPSRVILLTSMNPIPAPIPAAALADYAPHGTHVAGSIAGDGFNAPPPPAPGGPPVPAAAANRTVPRGVAPRARLVFHSVNSGPPVGGVPAPLNFGNFLGAVQQAYDRGARVHNNSWRTAGTNNYTAANSQAIDQFAFLHPDMLLLFAAGNDESDVAPADGVFDMNVVGEQAVCKNILVVGACENVTRMDGFQNDYRGTFLGGAVRWAHAAFNIPSGVMPPVAPTPVPPFYLSDSADNMALFSTRGRVNDPAVPPRRRVRPDVVAPGTNITSTGPRAMLPFGPPMAPTTAPANFYFVTHGTSMATPLTSGACALVRQFYRTRFTELRRPLLVAATSTATPPVPFVDTPAVCAHQSGCVLAWVHPDAAAGPNHIRAAVYNRRLTRIGNVVQLETNVGARPAVCVERRDARTLLAFRASDNTIRVSLFDDQLRRVNAFGTAGTVTLAPASRDEADRRPALCVQGDVAAVAWVKAGSDDLIFRRMNAETGVVSDATPKKLGVCTNTSIHPYLLHNGDKYAAAWARLEGADHKVLLRFVNTAGNPVGTQPFTLATDAQRIRDVHLAWDARANLYVLVWVRENAPAGASIFALRVNPDGTAVGAPTAIFTAAAPSTVRRPRVAPLDLGQYTLTWEDNTQNGTFDLYLAFPTVADIMGGTLTGVPLRISDTPQDTGGFASLTDNEGVLPVWQSNDEINSDMLGVFALNVTRAGVFDAQRDPSNVLLENGRYTRRLLLEHTDLDLTPVAFAWGGGDLFQLRLTQGATDSDLKLVHLSADGKPDASWSADGSKTLDTGLFFFRSGMLLWTGRRLVVAYGFALASRVVMVDGNGNPDTAFGTNGVFELAEFPTDEIAIQVGRRTAGMSARLFVVYGKRSAAGPHMIRYTVLNETGGAASTVAVPQRNLVPAEGTARHGWFHVLDTGGPNNLFFIAAWHAKQGARTVVLLNLFELLGTPQPAFPGHITLTLQAAVAGNPQTPLPGDSKNAVVAPRPVFFGAVFPLPPNAAVNSRRREFGAAWQYQPAPASAWEIRFSRLNTDGTVRATAPNPAGGTFNTQNVQVVADAAQHCTEPQLVWHTDGYGLAWLQQPVAGGPSKLFFTVLDQNGARVRLPGFGPAGAVGPAPNFALSEDAADVKAFQLVWNGRTFRITWTEIIGDKLRHMQSALSVPRATGGTQFDDPYKHPTSALIRATVINGATNFNNTSLPNVPTAVAPPAPNPSNPNDGYGWGRVNLRQALSPVPPVTFFVRDDSTVAAGRTVRYEFLLQPNTDLLRVTLAWTDLPGNNIVNHLGLRVTDLDAAPVRVFVGNRWQTAAPTPTTGPAFSNPLPTPPPANPFEDIHNVQQVVIPRPTAGRYLVEVVGVRFGSSPFMQFPGQPFALVFVGSGPEIRTGRPPAPPPPAGPVPVY